MFLLLSLVQGLVQTLNSAGSEPVGGPCLVFYIFFFTNNTFDVYLHDNYMFYVLYVYGRANSLNLTSQLLESSYSQ